MWISGRSGKENKFQPDVMLVIVLAIAVVAVALFFWALRKSDGLSSQAVDWGYFGDYIGGVVGSIVALFALWAVIYAIKIQRQELDSAKEELALSREALQQQVHHFMGETQIADLRAAISHLEQQIDDCMNKEIQVYLNAQNSRNTSIAGAIFDQKFDLKSRASMVAARDSRELPPDRLRMFDEVVRLCLLFGFLAKLLWQIEVEKKQVYLALSVKIKYCAIVSRLSQLDYLYGSDALYLRQFEQLPECQVRDGVPVSIL